MPWVRLDDRFPSHRKVALLSDRAFRLHVSAICWCAENLTDGRIRNRELALVAHVRNVKATAQQLEDAGLWDRTDDGWEIHDYLDYNPSREQVIAERKKNAARQEAFRRRKNGKPVPPDGSSAPPSNDSSNGVTRDGETHDGDTTGARRRHDGDTTATGTRPVPEEEPQVTPIRNGVTNGAPTRPDPNPISMAEEGRESAGSKTREREALSLIAPHWKPSDADREAATADIRRLGPKAVANATAKFIRHQQTRAIRAADFGPAWVTWLARERPDTQGAFLVGLPGGATPAPSSFAERMAEIEAAAARDDRPASYTELRDHNTA